MTGLIRVERGWELVNVIKDKSDIPSKHKMIYYFKREKISKYFYNSYLINE